MKNQLPFQTWKKYEDQTKIKHLVFADYFDKWMKILGRYYKLNYFDGYGGCGAYENKEGYIEYGSPILAAQIVKKNKLNLTRNIKFIIIDVKKENIENIKKIFDYLKLDIDPIFVNADFDKTVNDILDKVDLAPTFFFIDPFGFKIKMKTLRRIMEQPKAEILLNFMYNSITRWLKLDLIHKTLTELFGGEDWQKLSDQKGSSRESEIIDFYRDKLKKFSRFVSYYRLSFPNKNRTYYYLFHLTNNIKGCSIMKSCFAKYNFGRLEYKGKLNNQKNLFDFSDLKERDIERVILSILDKPKSYLDVLEELIDEVPYLEKEIYQTLKKLEQDKNLLIKRDPEFTKTGKKRISIQEQDVIMKQSVS